MSIILTNQLARRGYNHVMKTAMGLELGVCLLYDALGAGATVWHRLT